MRAIYNMQSNCTALNSCIEANYKEFKQDYCKINTFTGTDLIFAIRCSPFIGASGLISFNNRSLVRTTIPLTLYQIQIQNDSNSTSVKIAEFDYLTAIFLDNAYFSGDQVPISSNFYRIYIHFNTLFLHRNYSRRSVLAKQLNC